MALKTLNNLMNLPTENIRNNTIISLQAVTKSLITLNNNNKFTKDNITNFCVDKLLSSVSSLYLAFPLFLLRSVLMFSSRIFKISWASCWPYPLNEALAFPKVLVGFKEEYVPINRFKFVGETD